MILVPNRETSTVTGEDYLALERAPDTGWDSCPATEIGWDYYQLPAGARRLLTYSNILGLSNCGNGSRLG
jgi:hypothetical protein